MIVTAKCSKAGALMRLSNSSGIGTEKSRETDRNGCTRCRIVVCGITTRGAGVEPDRGIVHHLGTNRFNSNIEQRIVFANTRHMSCVYHRELNLQDVELHTLVLKCAIAIVQRKRTCFITSLNPRERTIEPPNARMMACAGRAGRSPTPAQPTRTPTVPDPSNANANVPLGLDFQNGPRSRIDRIENSAMKRRMRKERV